MVALTPVVSEVVASELVLEGMSYVSVDVGG